jgi:hypothetical protein
VAAAAVAADAARAVVAEPDRFGIGWRPELAAGILAHREHFDVVEALADDWIGAGRADVRALATLAAQLPLTLHGVSLGLASAHPVATRRLDALARLVERVRPRAWSEHLAFVRAGGRDIGHLAAPPRADATLEGLVVNVARARTIVGAAPLLENVATLIEPPASDRDEAMWLRDVVAATGAPLLLDLHNLHANALNFGFDAAAVLERLPLSSVQQVHLAGGRWIGAAGAARLLDDHCHAVPDAVFALLETLGALVPGPLTIILERDGAYPPITALVAELERARAALARGRARARPLSTTDAVVDGHDHARESTWTARAETVLARLYVDDALRAAFVDDPAAVMHAAGLARGERAALARLDRVGLELAAQSFAAKRAHARRRAGWLTRLARW